MHRHDPDRPKPAYPEGFVGSQWAARLLGIPVSRVKRFAKDRGIREVRAADQVRAYSLDDIMRIVDPKANKLRPDSRAGRSGIDRPSLAPDNEEGPTTSLQEAAGPIVRVRDRDQRSLGPLTSTESLSAKDFRNVS